MKALAWRSRPRPFDHGDRDEKERQALATWYLSMVGDLVDDSVDMFVADARDAQVELSVVQKLSGQLRCKILKIWVHCLLRDVEFLSDTDRATFLRSRFG